MTLDYRVRDTSQRAMRSHAAQGEFIVSHALGGAHDISVIRYLVDALNKSNRPYAFLSIANEIQLHSADTYLVTAPLVQYQSLFLRGTQLVDEHNILPTSGWMQNEPSGAFGEVVSTRSTVREPSHKDVFDNLRKMGLERAANRLTLLKKMADEDANEPAMQIKSLQHVAQFLISERWLKQPRVGLSPDGLLQIEWLLQGGGVLAMWFLIDGRVQFVATEGNSSGGNDGNRVSGVFRKDDMLRAVFPFTRGLIRE